MDFVSPAAWPEALAAKAARPDAVPIMGGTDVMVELNLGRRRPPALLDLTRVPELARWHAEGGYTRVGAGVCYTRLAGDLRGHAPALADAARSVASPQIRNRGSVGGNLGGASPAGDCHPPLLATGALVELASAGGVRRVPAREFYLGPGRTVRRDDELVAAVLLPRPAGPQVFAKVGPRNAMVIAVVSFALALDTGARRVGTGIGSAGPTPLRAEAAEEFLAAEFDWAGGAAPAEAAARRFGELVAGAARPIDDVRGSAAYRRHALAVLARRAWVRCAAQLRRGGT
ncbi:CO/xanthine dehydrogenase FAD-binding subunit [Streptomonospora nanhaiensis]|uniref:CO/xanthine dehydrogenase FAD-binding subunit n=1 Tax=Streptomonospora nanhaiensis TaxID=1323731 RepID=A0A853BHH3_9ACTN|nr:FAD binding domain-containing protein [Streptomonospora nanhaiensis]NYI94071.1 CO/xanthine dehydrogenase FAD-binding subunit [Streptomonospora nanhaiensis]